MNEYLKGWLQKANSDYKILELLVNSKSDLVTDGICFHSQQGVEKLLKAFLLSNDKKFPETHNLDLLQKICVQLDTEFNKFDFQTLGLFAVQIRYGNELYFPSDEIALNTYNIAVEVKDFVFEKLNVNEDDLKL